MMTSIKIALSDKTNDRAQRYFTLRLKSELRNELCEFEPPKKLLAVSDIEGNFNALCKLLIRNGVMDKYYHWTFDDGHLVIVGDCFDRGEKVMECLWLVYSLEEKAKRKGGYVHYLLGNHEIMNMNGDWRYIHPRYAEKIAYSKTLPTAIYHGNNELWNWLRTKNIIEKIGNLLFVHAGIDEELLKLNMSLADINCRVRPYYTQANVLFTDPLLYTVLNSSNSPFWYRGYYQLGANEKLIDDTLAYFKVDTIIAGHTVMDHVTPFYNGKLININNDHTSENSEALLIRKNRFYRTDRTGKRIKIK